LIRATAVALALGALACAAPRVRRDVVVDSLPKREFASRTEAARVALRGARLRVPRDDLASTVVELDPRTGGTVVIERWLQGAPDGLVATLVACDLGSGVALRFRRDSAAGSVEIELAEDARASEEGASVAIAPRRPLRLFRLLDPVVPLPGEERASAPAASRSETRAASP